MLRLKRTMVPAGTRRCWPAAVLLIVVTGCRGSEPKAMPSPGVTLTIGFGLAAGTSPEVGVQQVARNIAFEQLVSVPTDGRTLASLAESWSLSNDGLTLQLRLRPSAMFHGGKPADAESIRQVLQRHLPNSMGPAFGDVASIRSRGPLDIEFTLRKRSSFLLEALGDTAIQEPQATLSGTGPYFVVSNSGNEVVMQANQQHYDGKPTIDHIVIKPYSSVRAAWADMLRGLVDMLYDVGVDALDSLKSSNDVSVFTFQRGYAYLLLLNVQRPSLSDANFRRELNAAIDRQALVDQVWSGHGAPADEPVWHQHWAYSAELPHFTYRPRAPGGEASAQRFTCLVIGPSHERLALAAQRQLQAIGVNMELEYVPTEEGLTRLQNGNFDAILADYRQGPNLVRPYLFWHSGSPNNWGHYRNAAVDSALDRIRYASTDNEYRSGVGVFQQAIVNDPPAIFLTWRERARAVSHRFKVVAKPGADVLTTIHKWRAATRTSSSRN